MSKSDSDEDWFDKDIDDFKVDKLDSGVENISFSNYEKKNSGDQFSGGPSNLFQDADYGGNYNKPNAKKNVQSDGKSSGNGSSSNRQAQPMSFKKLSFVMELSPLNIFLEILQPDSGFFETINRSTNSREVINLTLKAIGKILELPLNEYKRYLLSEIIDAKTYWKQIEKYLKESAIEPKTAKDKKKIIVVQSSDKELWDSVVLICRNIIAADLTLDKSFVDYARKLVDNSRPEKNLIKYQEDFQQIEQLLAAANDPAKIVHKDIVPSLDELKETEPVFLKPNIEKGQYPSIAEYLDVQLALLREDFISPLRDGIVEFRAGAVRGKFKSNSNIKYYPKVRILSKQRANTRSHKGEYLMIDLEPDARDRGDSSFSRQPDNAGGFVYSKKLMYGSLVFFTQTHDFDDLILAVVSNRDTEMLNQGYIQIEIVKTYNITGVFGRDFMMFESETYFEPYHQVYKVLSNFDHQTFPLSNYIVSIDQSHSYPGYFPAQGKVVYKYRKHALDMKATDTWPTAAALKLNESQLDSIKFALTNKFALVQGPPGTGKTLIGLEMLSILLRNTEEQILVICNTNHALDQFLTGALQYTDEIVRMGNQSKNELLDQYNVKQLTESVVSDKRMKSCFYKAKCDYVEFMGKFDELQSRWEQNVDRHTIEAKMLQVQEKLHSITKKQEELKQCSEYYVLKSKRVIGMTSTCAARCNTLLHLLKSSIVFVEEAAELLESHLIAALTKDTQHVILIGDHQQLRPTTSVYKLAKMYKMDISLFERMINNGINGKMLKIQHRMRPEFANLIRPSIYKDLLDHDNVLLYPDMMGIDKNLLFFNHSNPETTESDETSKKNLFEAQYLVALCNYFILQGYAPEDVTILTTYNGQLFQFSQERRKYPNLRKVRITVVDNYQGEESKIILLSLVRNNADNKIGYLALKNRICVTLSRAKEGLFIMGNIELLAKNNGTWKKIRAELQQQDAIVEEINLRCQMHGNVTTIKSPGDFDMVKFGGCQMNCSEILDCGHVCSYFCHTKMFNHYSNCECMGNGIGGH